jgi:hypothetical protein
MTPMVSNLCLDAPSPPVESINRPVPSSDNPMVEVFGSAALAQTIEAPGSRHVLLCYKVQFRLRKIANEIEQKGQNKYAFVHRARYLLWALICQGLLNHPDREDLSENFGRSMTLPADYTELLSQIATTRVRVLGASGILPAEPARRTRLRRCD